jgi:hypothetical protein
VPVVLFCSNGAVDIYLRGIAVMNRNVWVVACISCFVTSVGAQDREAVVKKDALSVHTVERGSMPIFTPASGTLTSLQPRRAVLSFDKSAVRCEAGLAARLVVAGNTKPLAGKVVRRTDDGNCEVEFVELLPEGATVGRQVGGLIMTDEMKDIVFFGRPAISQPNSTATLFVLEGNSHARRVRVRYGVISGPLIQVLDGLVPGERVIVTDMSKWADVARVRLE